MIAACHWLLSCALRGIPCWRRVIATEWRHCLYGVSIWLCFCVMQFFKKITINRRPNETVPYLTYSDNILPHPIKTLVRQDIWPEHYFSPCETLWHVLNLEKILNVANVSTHRKANSKLEPGDPIIIADTRLVIHRTISKNRGSTRTRHHCDRHSFDSAKTMTSCSIANNDFSEKYSSF